MIDLQELKQLIPIESIVGEYVRLTRVGASLRGLCPFHQEKTPSFYVSPEKGSFRCFGCGKGGDVIAFLQEIEHVDFREAVERLARRAGIEVQLKAKVEVTETYQELYDINETASLYFQALLAAPEGMAVRTHLRERGIDDVTREKFGLGAAPSGWDGLLNYLRARGISEEQMTRAGLVVHHAESGRLYDRFRNRLMFPIREGKGRLSGFGARALDETPPKYLNSPETPIFSKGKVLFLLDHAAQPARHSGKIVVVEGYFDALAAHQAGFANVVASLGTALTEEQLRLLRRLAVQMVIALDADVAGQSAVRQTIQRLYELQRRGHSRTASEQESQMTTQVLVVQLPDGEDPDEIIRRNPAEWQQLVAEAAPALEYCLQAVLTERERGDRIRRAQRELVPLIATLTDSLERGYWIDRIAQRLGIPEQVVFSAVQRYGRSVEMPAAKGMEEPLGLAVTIGDRQRYRYILSMLWRHPRLLEQVREAMSELTPEDERLAALWRFTLDHGHCRTTEDLLSALSKEEDDLLTIAYVQALVAETADLASTEDAIVVSSIRQAIDLIQQEWLRQEMMRLQEALERADENEKATLIQEIARLTQARRSIHYNREH